ncbi:MAG: chorismate-binding protein [Chitinophagales bacterium]|nr:chorismate-binding protein [Chitinophagales bacterium]
MAFTQNIISIYNLINECLQRHLPFAAYRLPGDKGVQLVLQENPKVHELANDEKLAANKGFAFYPFPGSHAPKAFIKADFHLCEENITEAAIIGVLTRVGFSQNGYKKSYPHQATKKEYCDGVEQIISEIKKGTLQKGVLSRVHLENVQEGFSSVELFKRLVKIYPNACAYITYIPHTGLWIGATPELLLQTEDNELRTVSLAGTKKVEGGRSFNWGLKELEEQKIVTDTIKACLEKYFPNRVETSAPATVIAGPMEHLKTTFKVNAEKHKINEAIDALINDLHPTPAVAGMPKQAALDIIRKTEKHNRDYYTGFLGPVNIEEKTSLFVNLRCLEVLDKHLALYVGAGITAASDPDAEWEETKLKTKTLLNVL